VTVNGTNSALTRVHAKWSEVHGGHSVEWMLAFEVFQKKAAEQRRLVEKFERDGSESRKIRQVWGDPRSPERDIRLTPGDVDWGQLRAKANPVDLGEGISLRFPKRALDRLERGLAYGQTWRKQYPVDAPVRTYSSFEEWALEQVAEWLDREVSRLGDDEEKAEWEALYPGIAERPKPARPQDPGRQMIASSGAIAPSSAGKWEPISAGRGLNPHRPHQRGPQDR
jgi:hypothetical protein